MGDTYRNRSKYVQKGFIESDYGQNVIKKIIIKKKKTYFKKFIKRKKVVKFRK